MSRQVLVDIAVLVQTVEAIKDAVYELEQPEVSELVSGALDRKLSRALTALEAALK